MKDGVFYGKGVNKIKTEYPEIFEAIVKLDEAVFTGRVLDYRTQKLVALAIVASRSDESATKRQMISAMNEFKITKDEIVDVLRVVLLTSGMPAFNKGMRLLDEIEKQ
ncbi:MAG: Carboxymuconolactone decarboxylase family protein [Candidatus Methanofastidiosum methylothiophilum]|uniref:Carboxymuconolactone decarboxylase family protein n=1 Tax=Candidatus Methanofastidiosum methylothiophilum TaxID=1705564 RepID=A0A150JAY4_9EURY|nr:MAG: Carboxymuconolactone decarboxylase family protein [Candidatus Methanofastidiosum methylthiophilus]NMC77334.1 carboxymuconolactone decarboxylase family protein [Candidatus Methanofastidiosa archaeon]